MWDESFGKEIARILNLMADKPNATRGDPERGETELFDGGKCTVMSGLILYKFSDGSEAFYGSEIEWGLTIELATGEKVSIEISPPNSEIM